MGSGMPRRTSRRLGVALSVELLVERLDELGRKDPGYRRLTLAVRRALRRLLPLLDQAALAKYMAVETAVNARDVYSTDALTQWAYWLGLRDGATPIPRVGVRKGAVKKLTRLRKAQPR